MVAEVVPNAIPYQIVTRTDFSDATYLLEVSEPREDGLAELLERARPFL